MCFTPAISLSTAIFEFIVATAILLFCRKSTINKFFALMIYVLGFYQFTEFMLCTSSYPFFWAKMGFITYSFLPAIGLHFVMRLTKRKFEYVIVYFMPVIFSAMAILKPDFIIESFCTSFFVIVHKNIPTLLVDIYGAYYFGFILLFCYLLLNSLRKEKDDLKRKEYAVIFAATTISLLPPVILFIIFPAFKIIFPSVYCQFAVLFTVAAIIACYLDNKIQNGKKIKTK